MCCAGSGSLAPHVGVVRSKYLVSFQLLDSHHESYAGTRRWPFRELLPGAGGFKAPAIGDCLLSGSIVRTAPGPSCGEKRSDHQRLPSVGAFTNDQRPGRELGPANVLRRKHLHPHQCAPVCTVHNVPAKVRRVSGARVGGAMACRLYFIDESEKYPSMPYLTRLRTGGKMQATSHFDGTIPAGPVYHTAQ